MQFVFNRGRFNVVWSEAISMGFEKKEKAESQVRFSRVLER